MKTINAVNWNSPDNDYAEMFWEQNLKQFWIDTEYIPSKDIDSWRTLSEPMREAYKKALGGLTLLDTLQSHTGMPKIIDHIDSLQNKSVLSYMCMMETIHAKSYSTIFTTVASNDEIDAIFNWASTNKLLQFKAQILDDCYRQIDRQDSNKEDLFMALSASVLLETFLFYSGFFLPLWLAGQGKMVASCDIIKKIISDESIHGLFVGILAQETFNTFDNNKKEELKNKMLELMDKLYKNELKYTEEIYNQIGLSSEVKEFIRYNGNKALMNLGFEPIYQVADINPIVLNGLNTETTQHDFFSKKSTNYEKTLKTVYLKDDDFELTHELLIDI